MSRLVALVLALLCTGCPPSHSCVPDRGVLWEEIDDAPWEATSRTRVPGGWLVQRRGSAGSSMAFVPDAEGAWLRQSPEKP